MTDLAKIKRNVTKMAGMGAPESDIDSYISSQGVTIEQVRSFKATSPAQAQQAVNTQTSMPSRQAMPLEESADSVDSISNGIIREATPPILNNPRASDGSRAGFFNDPSNFPAGFKQQTPDEYSKEQSDNPEVFSGMDMVKNIPSSAGDLAKALYQTVSHPIETGKGVWNLGTGALQKAIPGEQGNEKYADALVGALKNRYGGKQEIINTLETDPVGALLDVSSVLTGGAPLLGKTALKAGTAIDPVNLVKNTATVTAGKMVPKNFAHNQMASAVKFNTTTPRPDRDKMIKTMLDEQIAPTYKGMDKIDSITSNINQEIHRLIDNATNSGKKVRKEVLYSKLKDLRKQYGGAKVDAPHDLAAIDSVISTFDQHMRKIGKDTLTPAELQKFKTNAYKKIKFDAKNLKSNQVTDDTRRAMAKAAKEKLEDIVPEVKDLNAREGLLLALSKQLEQKSNRIENLNNSSLTTLLNPAAGYSIGGPSGAALGYVLNTFDKPKVKAKAALLADSLMKKGSVKQYLNNDPKKTALIQALMNSGRVNEQLQEP